MRWMALLALSAALTLSGAPSCRYIFGTTHGGSQNQAPAEVLLSFDRETERAPLDSHSQRPPEISSVLPKEHSTACPTSEVGARFSLSGAMLENGQMDVSAFHLMLDGQDVTAKTDVRGTMDFPQSSGELFYKPDTPLSPGSHEARVSFPDEKTGDTRHYTWGFDVKKATCNYKVNTRTSEEHLY
jgi:hypothetical protein